MGSKHIWGTVCQCGAEVFTCGKEHPYGTYNNLIKKASCKNCNKKLEITPEQASLFYNKKVFNCFKDVAGNVLDLGCGGGLLTSYLVKKPEVNHVTAVDKEDQKVPAHTFIQLDLNNFNEAVFTNKFNYIVCRDVLMYLENIDYTFKKLSDITQKLVLLNWYNKRHKKIINKTNPKAVVKILKNYFTKVTLEYLTWYKDGYLICCEK